MPPEKEDDKLDAPDSSPEVTTDVPADSSTADAGATATDSPAVESTSATETPVNPGRTERETLIAQLTGVETEENDEPETPESEASADDPAKSDEAPAAPAPAKADAETATEPATPDEVSEEELIAPVDKHTKPATRKRIEALIADRKTRLEEIEKLKPLADYGHDVFKMIGDAKMSPEDFGAWFAFGAQVNQDPTKAPLLLMAEAERMARHFNVQLPSSQQPAQLQEIEDLILEGVTSMDLSGETAKKLLDKLKTARRGAPPVTPPVSPPVMSQQPAPQIQNPPPARTDPAIAQASDEINKLQGEYAKSYPADWPKMREAVKAAMSKYGGTDPRHWPQFFKQEVESVKAKFVVPKKPTISQTLRPTTAAAPKQPKTGKQDALDFLTGRSA